MTEKDVLKLFVADFLACPPSCNFAATALAKFLSDHHASLSPAAVELLLGIGGQLLHDGMNEWWNSTSVIDGTPTLLSQVIEHSKHKPGLVSRRNASLHEIQLLIIARQKRHRACDSLVFDAAKWKTPDGTGSNWDIEPMPLKNGNLAAIPYDCFCLMESYFYELRDRYNAYHPGTSSEAY